MILGDSKNGTGMAFDSKGLTAEAISQTAYSYSIIRIMCWRPALLTVTHNIRHEAQHSRRCHPVSNSSPYTRAAASNGIPYDVGWTCRMGLHENFTACCLLLSARIWIADMIPYTLPQKLSYYTKSTLFTSSVVL